MIKILKYSSIALFFASLAIHFSTFGPFEIFAIDGVWFMQIAVIAAFGAMMFYVKKLRNEKKREPDQKYVDWFRENIQLQMSENNKLAINAIPDVLFFLGIAAFIYVLINFGTCMVGMEFGGPLVEDGKFLLKNHGKVIRALTELEYRKMKSYEMRLFSGHWVIFSYLPALFFTYVYPATVLKREQERNMTSR
ncbi:hypothetical protein KP003_10860 [Geomonas nitrogeniifigens]|uniref:hypothetical protein n=1 Tax=Geomonas diazotrophica TaxID=2843197 RepID=UPI001C2C5572|nr:hypothetical protein [Geomonas nitrogeniifigens]QXE84908.1 hypothetical protein KP003_10860 [Geomonas nitrogeniifigens]